MEAEWIEQFILSHRIARLATVDETGQPLVVPFCYAYDGHCLYTAIDEKPKRAPESKLKRIRNIESNPKVCAVIDYYEEDWSKLAYVIIHGLAQLLSSGDEEHSRAVSLLRSKYPQYSSMAIDRNLIIKITPTKITGWRASSVVSEPE